MHYLVYKCFITFLTLATEFRTTSFPYPFYFKSGEEIVLSCWIPDNYTFRYWAHPSNEFINSTIGRYLIERHHAYITLTITNTSATDGGFYTCHACELMF